MSEIDPEQSDEQILKEDLPLVQGLKKKRQEMRGLHLVSVGISRN